MDKNAVLEILTSIENKIDESEYAKYTKDLRLRPNITNVLQERIDDLSKKLSSEKNYLDASAKDYNDLNEDYLRDCEEQKKANEERIKSIDYRLSMWEENKSQQEKILKSLKKELSGSTKKSSTKKTKKLTKQEEKLIEYKNAHSDPRDEFKNAINQLDDQTLYDQKAKDLEQIKNAISSFKKEKADLVSKNAELEKQIKDLKELIKNFSINLTNSVDNVLRRRDGQELSIYKKSLEKYKSHENMYSDFFQEEIKQLKEDYSNDVITINQLIEKVELLNTKLNVKFEDEKLHDAMENDLMKEADDFIESLKIKVSKEENYKYSIQPTDEEVSILNGLKNDMMVSQSEIDFYRPRLETVKGKIELYESLIKETEKKSNRLKDKTGKFVTVKDEREEAIEKQIEEDSIDIKKYKSIKKIYIDSKYQIEKMIVSAMETNSKLKEEIKAYETKISGRTGIDVHTKEEDVEKKDTLSLCKSILGFKTDMINFSIDDELKALQEQKTIENVSEEKDKVVDDNGNEIPSFALEQEPVQEVPVVEEAPVAEEPVVEQVNEEVPVEPTSQVPSFVYEKANEDNQVEVSLGDGNISFDQVDSAKITIDGNEIVDDKDSNPELRNKVRNEDVIDSINRFFDEKEKELKKPEESINSTDEITVTEQNGNNYTFDLGEATSIEEAAIDKAIAEDERTFDVKEETSIDDNSLENAAIDAVIAEEESEKAIDAMEEQAEEPEVEEPLESAIEPVVEKEQALEQESSVVEETPNVEEESVNNDANQELRIALGEDKFDYLSRIMSGEESPVVEEPSVESTVEEPVLEQESSVVEETPNVEEESVNNENSIESDNVPPTFQEQLRNALGEEKFNYLESLMNKENEEYEGGAYGK